MKKKKQDKQLMFWLFNRFKMMHQSTYYVILIILANFLICLYFTIQHDMVTFDGTYYLRYYNGDNSWLGPFPFGYPLIIQFFKFFISDEILAASLSVTFFASALLFPLYQILVHLFSKRLSLLLLFIAAFNPVVLYYSTVTYSEFPYMFFLIFSLWMFLKKNQFLAVLFASISYLIRPEGLIFAIAFTIIFFIKDRKWKNLLAATLIILSFILLFMVENHSRTDEWTISTKIGTINSLREIDNWQKNELLKYTNETQTVSMYIQHIADVYPKRLLVLLKFINTASSWPLVTIGLIGLIIQPNIFWLFILQLLLTPLSGINMSLRLGLPYFYALLIGSGLLLNTIGSRKKIKIVIVFILLISVVFISNLKYLRQPTLNDPDFVYIEAKGVGLYLKGKIQKDAVIMDRKPYITFYSNAGKYVEIPLGPMNDVFKSITENDVDYLILTERTTKMFRPYLAPLLYEEEQNVGPWLYTVFNDININKGYGTRIYGIRK